MSQTSSSRTVSSDKKTSPNGGTQRPPAPSQGARSAHRLHRLRRWSLALADTTGIATGILVASEIGKMSAQNQLYAIGIVPIWIFVAKLYNLYDRDDRRIQHSTVEEIPSLLATAAITVVLAKIVTEVLPIPVFLSSAMIIIGAVAVVVSFILRATVRQLYRQIAEKQRTIVIGSGAKAALVAKRLTQEVGSGIQLSGYVAESPNGTHDGPANLGVEYFGTIRDLPRIAGEQGIARVVIADDNLSSKAIGAIINTCREAQVAVTLVPANQEVLGPDTELNRIAEVPMLDFHFSIPPRSTMAIKRALDITVSGTLLILTSPFLLLSAIFIKLDSKGPVFFRQVRIGKNGKRFTMFKLRTMVADAEARLDSLIDLDALEEPVFKIPNDPRITRVGKFLRRSSLDEVPQFINVLKGDMSLVGPRPEEEAVVALYDERQRQRLSVKPGLTGPMQVAGRGSLNFEERLALERDYLDNLTISGDISILLRTPQAVVRGDGAF
ncbi:MAG TPA: sugar transferase [Solirubrobacterales bacterium]|nr:sugar transferase [Solirubrobacterales bacterium]